MKKDRKFNKILRARELRKELTEAKKLGIEIDGLVHKRQKDYDIARQVVLEDAGIEILRFSNDQVFCNLNSVFLSIKEKLNPSPSLMEKGGCDKLLVGD